MIKSDENEHSECKTTKSGNLYSKNQDLLSLTPTIVSQTGKVVHDYTSKSQTRMQTNF